MCCLVSTPPLRAQNNDTPLLEVEMPETETIPGQPLALTLTVLVPTFMPKPVEFPSFDAPNIRVVLPEMATQAMSRWIAGKTWSGVSRRILIIPLVPGRFTIPPQAVEVTYSDPDNQDAVQSRLQTPAIEFSSSVPDKAASLDPFIAANKLTLGQKIEGEPEQLNPGDSLRITVTATVEGNSPMILPRLMAEVSIAGVSAYPDTPELQEQFSGNALSGSRRESLVLMAETNTTAVIPAVSLRWYNLATDSVETASTSPVSLRVSGAPPPGWLDTISNQGYGRLGLAATALVLILALLWRTALPLCSRIIHRARNRYLASESRAFRRLGKAIHARDLPLTLNRLLCWQSHLDLTDDANWPSVQEKLAVLGAARYGHGKESRKTWHELWIVLKQLRQSRKRLSKSPSSLVPLNPS